VTRLQMNNIFSACLAKLTHTSTLGIAIKVFLKTFLAVLLITPALNFWYILVLLLLSKSLPASLGIEALAIGDVISLPVITVFAVIIAVMASIYFTADLLERG